MVDVMVWCSTENAGAGAGVNAVHVVVAVVETVGVVAVFYFVCFFAFFAAFFSWFFIVFDLTMTAQATTVAEPVTGWAGGKGGGTDSSWLLGGVLLLSRVLDDLDFLAEPFSSSASAWSSSAADALTRSACLASLSAEA